MSTHTMSWLNIRRSMRRLRQRQAEDVIHAIRRYLRAGADPLQIKGVTGIPLGLIRKIKSDHATVVADVIRWRAKASAGQPH